MKKIDGSTPSVKFLKTISTDKLSRKAASRIAQLRRLGHIPLNSYLHRFKRADKANCAACGEDFKSPSHFLLSCRSYAFERWALERQARKKKSLTLETLLGDPDLALPLGNYIDGTGRFKQLLGEQTHTQSANTSRESD